MSSLTRLLAVDSSSLQLSSKGKPKRPLIMEIPVPAEFEVACISKRDGGFHLVNIKERRPTRTGFFDLPYYESVPAEEEGEGVPEWSRVAPYGLEDQIHAALIKFLFETGSDRDWGGVASYATIPEDLVDSVDQYFEAYGMEPHQVFSGVVGLAALYDQDLIEFPEEVDSEEDLTDELFRSWMSKYLCVGTVGELPVHYNPYMILDIAITAMPEVFGYLFRAGDRAAVLVHNAERAGIYIRTPLEALKEHPDELSE